MTKTVDDIRVLRNLGKVTYIVSDFFNFKTVLEHLMPNDKISNLGAKYTKIGLNFFRNDYLRDIINMNPAYNDLLRVISGDNDYRTNKISSVEFNHQR